MTTFIAARIYEPAHAADGYRVLIDRLWPRGISKERADLDEWCKELAPSTELRTWWNHEPARRAEFAARYRHELDQSADVPDAITRLASHDRVTLLYAAHDPQVTHANVLRDYLAEAAASAGNG
ncbi:DUF488 domain-containing protein [Salinibacterium sp. SWN248]|uniref:DUF488 domain-containing protein n=1 Tax=Salinibacterium sp. SWN248 TaxID=2792056 RepID=UPI0018CE8F78|nr:DUF488 family protein [Salinibacterium sp. SWN248]MBH0025138.1 DUF488 family protein [Salinibacterium sp. SWN248]